MNNDLVPLNDNRKDFVQSAISLLHQSKMVVETPAIPFDWGQEIEKFAIPLGYKVSSQVVPLKSGKLSPNAIYYYKRSNSN